MRWTLNFAIIFTLHLLLRINDTVAMITLFVCMLFFLIFGILFINNKGARVYSIMNNKPLDVLEEYYDKKALLRYEGWLNIILSLGFVGIIPGIYFEIKWLPPVVCVYWIIVIICFVVYSKKNNQFRK